MIAQKLRDCLDKNYQKRKRRLREAIENGAQRTDKPLRSNGEGCAMCNRKEHGGGLVTYLLRDGQELLVGQTCAEYLDYLAAHPDYAGQYGN